MVDGRKSEWTRKGVAVGMGISTEDLFKYFYLLSYLYFCP